MGLLKSIQSVLGLYVSPDPSKVLGIDTSHWTGVVDWNVAKAAGVKFAIIKAMDGITPTKYFVENYKGAKAAGIAVGAYSWLYSAAVLSPGRQARAYADLLRQYPCELPPTVDFEWTASGNPTWDDLWGFVSPLEQIMLVKPMIYTAYGYWRQYGSTNSIWAGYPLWTAQYGVTTPTSYAPWNGKHTIWQFTDRGEGVKYGFPATGEKMADLNYFNGTIEEFYTWIGKTPPVVVPEVTPVPVPTYKYAYVKKRYVSGGPAIVAGSDAPKANHPNVMLDKDGQSFVYRLNSFDDARYNLFIDPNVGPTKGLNSNGKAIYIPAGWSGNVVKITAIAGAWAKVDSIKYPSALATQEYSYTKTPHLIHRMTTVNSSNGFVDFPPRKDGTKSAWTTLDVPLFSYEELWLPLDWLNLISTVKIAVLNIRTIPSISGSLVGRRIFGDKMTIINVIKDSGGNVWGQSTDGWSCLMYNRTNYTDWDLVLP